LYQSGGLSVVEVLVVEVEVDVVVVDREVLELDVELDVVERLELVVERLVLEVELDVVDRLELVVEIEVDDVETEVDVETDVDVDRLELVVERLVLEVELEVVELEVLVVELEVLVVVPCTHPKFASRPISSSRVECRYDVHCAWVTDNASLTAEDAQPLDTARQVYRRANECFGVGTGGAIIDILTLYQAHHVIAQNQRTRNIE